MNIFRWLKWRFSTSFSTFILEKSFPEYRCEYIFVIFSLGPGFLFFKFMKKVSPNGLFEDGISQILGTFFLF